MIKVYDSSLEKYVTIASNRGDNLYTKSINFDTPELPNYDNDSSIITIDEALTSLSKEIKKNKEGIAWVYKNGTIGGGGGGTGSGMPKFKITTKDSTITNDSIIVNNNQTLTLSFSITGSSIGRKMNITIKDNKGNFYGYNNSLYTISSQGTNIQIPNIKEDLYIEFTGYDQETLSTIETYVLNIKVSELKITAPETVQISKSDTEYMLTYDIKTTYGQNTYLLLSTKVNNEIYTYQSETFSNSKIITVDIFSIFEGLELEEILKNSLIDNLEIKAEVHANPYMDSAITSIVFTEENKISIDITPLSNIIENGEPSYEYLENDNITFNIKLYFSTNEFYMAYKLYQIIDGVENVVYKRGDFDNPTSNENKKSSTEFYSKNNPITITYPNTINSSYPVYMYVKSWSRNDITYLGERSKWFKIKSDATWSPYNLSLSGLDTHIDGGLNYLYYEYNQTKLGNEIISNKWNSSRKYKGSSNKESLVEGYIKYFNANNITNGILLRGKSNENVNTFRMSTKSYGVLYNSEDNIFTPFGTNNNWFKGNEGWSISLTFKSDNQPDIDNVIFSCATFTNKGELNEGIYITTEDVKVRFTNSTKQVNKWNLSAKLTQNTLNQVDIVYKPKTLIENEKTINVAEIRIYINGVLSSAGIETDINFENNNYYPTINSEMILGATYNKNYMKYADVNFYRLLFYKRALAPYHINKNLIQGCAEIELMNDGNIDKTKNNELRNKNFFTNDGKCALINSEDYSGECSYVNNLYTTLSTSGTNPLPLVLVKVNDANFKSVINNRYNEAEVAADKLLPEENKKITKEYPCVITIIKEKSNKAFVMGSESNLSVANDFAGKDCTVKLQGTTTLGNKSKNLELSFGATNEQEHLVQPFEDLLPENSWIAKADVMDSGHANNAAIGGFINDYLSKYSTTANQMSKNMYKEEIKATTEGHPVMMFIQYGDAGTQEFLGIYSFNLGRISYYNLGYQVFDGYYKVKSEKNGIEKEVKYENHKVVDTTIEFPALVSNYKSIAVPYNSNLSGVDSGATTVVCYECNGNNNIVGSFQQSSNDIINEFYNRVYPNIDNNNSAKAFERFRKLFVATSNLYECDPDYLCKMEEGDEYLKTRSLLLRNAKGEFKNKETNEYEIFNKANIDLYEKQESWSADDFYESLVTPQTNENDTFVGLNWDFASAYFTLAMLFGLTDSLGKNLNIRSFDLTNWYLSFYDMDTGLALTNSGYETVKKDVYLDTFELASNKRENIVNINGYNKGGYDTYNSRIFNIIRFFTNKAYPNTGSKPSTNYRKIWEDIRKTILKSPNDFIEGYYIKQNKNVGEIIFNYDYDIKYINDEYNLLLNPTSSGNTSINFLHGNRVNYVRDWFTKHVYFLDGVFDIKCNAPITSETTELYGNAAGSGFYGINSTGNIITDSNFTSETDGVTCPYIIFSNQNDRVNPTFDGYKKFILKANLPMFFIYNIGTISQRLFIQENKETEVELYFKSGNDQAMSFNYAPYLITFDKFGTLSYTNISYPNLSMLNELDLSDTKTLSGANFDISPLVELRKLNMNNTKVTGDDNLSVNLKNSYKISYIDLRNSDVYSLTLPGYGENAGGSLEELYVDKTLIENIDLTGHTILKKFSAVDCEELSTIIFKNNYALTNIGILPNNISKLTIDGCNSLKSISLNGMKQLSNDNFVLGYNEGLETFSYSYDSKAENIITELDFSGCPNLKEIILPNFTGEYITLNSKCKSTLEKIDFSNSNIKYIYWYDEETDEKTYAITTDTNKQTSKNVLDFIGCVKLNTINISGNKNIEYVLLDDSITLEDNNTLITYCESLRRIIGNLKVNVNKFTNLSKFRFNEVCKYDENDTTSNIILLENGDVELEDKNVIFNTDVDNNGNRFINYELNKLLTHYTFIEDNAIVDNSFSGTNINITDLYAILIKLKSWKSNVYANVSENNPGYISKFNKTFANCNNIKTFNVSVEVSASGKILNIINNSDYKAEIEYIKDNIFEGYDCLKELTSTFEKCTNIKGYINDIFKPITHLTNIENVFNGCGELYINNDIFNNNEELEIINKPFSDDTIGVLYYGDDFPNYYPIKDKVRDNSGIMLSPDTFFRFNKELKEIINIFSNTKIQFSIEEENGVYKFAHIEDIFRYNTKLKTIYNFLPNVYTGKSNNREPGELDLSNIFGGYYRYLINRGLEEDIKNIKEKFNIFNIEEFDNFYPRELETLDYAFAIDKNKLNENRPTLKWDNIEYIFYNLLPKEENGIYTNTLKSCAYMFDYLAYLKDDDDYYDYTKDAKFPINIFNIKDKEGRYVEFANLQSCEGLFMRASFKDTLYFPGNIFQNCTYNGANGLNLSHLLEDTYMTPIVLVNEDDVDEEGNNYVCFTNCKLGNISSMFKNCFKGINRQDFNEDNYIINGYKLDKGGLHGTIPYKFFKNKGKITNMSSVFEECCHLGTKYDELGNFTQRDINCFYNIRKPNYETVVDVSNGVKDVSLLLDLVEQNNEGVWNWNAWSYDGTIFDKEYLNALNNIRLGENNDTYSDAKHRNIPNYIDLIWLNGAISPDSSILLNLDSSKCKFANDNQLNSLKQSYYDASYLGLVKIDDTNSDYVYRIYYDADYDIKNVNFDSKLLASDKKQLWNCDSNTYLDLTGNNEPFNYRHTSKSDKDIKFISNYLCPMDLFRYSSPNCKIDNIFKNMSRFNNDDKIEKRNGYVYGLIGRIPPKLFTPLTALTSMTNVFENCKGINPYSQSLDGLLYNFTFNSNIEIAEMNGLLKGCMLLGSLSNNLFVNNTSLVSLNEFVKNGYMPYHYAYNNEGYDDYINFIPKTLFMNNGALTNLSNMFSRDNQSADENVKNSFIYFDLSEGLLDVNKHSFLSNVSFMFANQNNSNCGIQRNSNNKAQFIDFTKWKNKITIDGCYSGANFDLTLIPKEMGGTKEE